MGSGNKIEIDLMAPWLHVPLRGSVEACSSAKHNVDASTSP